VIRALCGAVRGTRAAFLGEVLLACPDCPTARDARALALGDGFIAHLLIAAAPFVLTLGLIVLIVRALQEKHR
jgi:hypothetical protein